MRVTVDRAQYRAINDLRGLPERAHSLVMCSSSTPDGGGVLDGAEEAFEELVSFVGEQIAEGMLSERAVQALWSACVHIDPDCAQWLGM